MIDVYRLRTVACSAVAVEAISTMTEILTDDILTRGRAWTLMPTGCALVHICSDVIIQFILHKCSKQKKREKNKKKRNKTTH